MSSRKQTKKRGRGVSAGFSAVMLLIGFVLGVYSSPQIFKTVPRQFLDLLGIEEPMPAAQKKTELDKPSKEQTEFKAGVYSIEIAVFNDLESALGLLDTLNTRGYSARLESGFEGDKVSYRVRLGLWTSQQEATKFAGSFETKEEMKAEVVKVK